MHYGIELVPFGPYSDPRAVVELAVAAEAAGWEAISLWDHLLFPYGAGDPWVTLAAVAQATQRLRLCTDVSPLPRYHPAVLARTLVGLDLLSGGRVTVGLGAGVDFDFQPLDPGSTPKVRAAMLDEGLSLLAALVAGEAVTVSGAYYHAENVQLVPAAVQKPRMPFWIGGDSPPAYRRAARWEGWVIGGVDEQQQVTMTPAQLGERVAAIRTHRMQPGPYDVAVSGCTDAEGRSIAGERLVPAYAAAGATWYYECLFATRGSHEELLARIEAGPPKER